MPLFDSEPLSSGDVRKGFDFQEGALSVWLAALAVFIGALVFNFSVGLIVFMGDSYLLADRAKHLILAGNLNLNNQLGNLIYPPLYAILISPAYLVSSPETSFQVILLIHSALVAAQIFPFYRLLREYSNLATNGAIWLAAVLSLAPFTLPYAAMMLTEVAYFPLLLWMTYFYLRFQRDGALADILRAGAFLGLMLLCRTAASTILVSTSGAFAFSLWRSRAEAPARNKQLIGLAALLVTFGAVFGFWKGYEKLFIQYGSTRSYFTLDDIRIIFAEGARFDHHVAWFTNTIFYYLTAPLSILGCFFYALLFRAPKKLLRDPLFPLAILSLIVSAATVVLVMTKGWGGRELTWNKYLAPYVFFIVLIGLRHRALFTKAQFSASVAALGLVLLAFKPSGLGCHFTDALVLFTSNTNPMRIPESIANALFFISIALPAWLWTRNSTVSRNVAIGLSAALWLASLLGTASLYRNSGDLNVSNYKGAAQQALALSQASPKTMVFYDPEFATKDMFGALRVLFYWPRLVTGATLAELPSLVRDPGTPVIYFTDKELPGVKHLAEDRGAVKAYAISLKALAAPAPISELAPPPAGSGLKASFPSTVWGAETAVWQGKPYNVRWLRASTEFEILNPGGASPATISMQLGVATSHHTIQLEANGEPAGERPVVTKVFWGHGPQDVAFRIKLKPGRNTFKLSTSDKLDPLPGGREVALLLIGDILATPK